MTPRLRSLVLFAITLALFTTAILSGSTGNFAIGAWTAIEPTLESRSGAAAAQLADGTVLVSGGDNGAGVTNSAEIYDVMSGTWSATDAMADARAGHTMTTLADGSVAVVGGAGNGGVLNSIELVDPSTGERRMGPSLMTGRRDHGAALLPDGRLLVVGGSDGANPLASTEIVDLESGEVTAGPELPEPRAGVTASALLNGKVLIAGGNNGEQDLASTVIYDPVTGSLSAGTNLTAARSGHTAAVLPNNNSVLIAGGKSGDEQLPSTELYVYWQNTSRVTGAMAAARMGAAVAGTGADGVAIVAGGNGQSAEAYGFPTVFTDDDDYHPGQTVFITGSGWQPGETVSLAIDESPALHTRRVLTAVADAGGSIANSDFAPEPHDVGVRFFLTATGQTSGRTARMTFKDAKATATVVTADINPSATGQTVTFTATVTETGGGGGAAGTAVTVGSVTFRDGGSNCSTGTAFATGVALNGSGQATATRTFSTGGSRTIRACYIGTGGSTGTQDSNGTVLQTVNATASTTTTVSAASATYGDSAVTLSATVAPNTVNVGSVTFTVKDGSNAVVGSATTDNTVVAGAASVSYALPSGTPAGSYTIEASYSGGTGFGASSGSGALTIGKAATTTTVTCSAGPFSYNGAAHEPCSATVTGAGGLNQSLTVAYLNNVSAGTATASASYAETTNYQASSDSENFSIGKAAVTATAGSGSGSYNGAAQSPSACAVTGAYTGDLSCANDPATVGPNVGTFTISPVVSGTGLTNFEITEVDGSYEITKAAVTATAGSGSGTYNGTAQSPSACAVTGAYTGDLTCANDPTSVGPNVGTFTISPVVSGTGLTNFEITEVDGSYEITKAAVTATAGSGSGTYNGAAQSPSACAVTGAYTGDLTCANDPTTVGPNVGTFTISPVVSGTGLTNFEITEVDGSYEITKAAVTATAGSGSGTYNGAAQSPSACAVTGAYTGDLICANDPATVGPNVGTFTISPVVSGTGLTNFEITEVDGSYEIAKAAVTATAGSGSGTYNGAAQSPSACAVTGAYTGDLTCANDPASVGPNVGIFTISPVVSGTGLTNFEITEVDGSYEIAKAAVTATAGSGSGTYNGAAQSPAACAVTGAYTGDLTCVNDPGTVGPNVGTFTISPVVSGTGLTNFDITEVDGSYEIAKAAVTATAGSGSGTYNGAAQSPSACAVTGAYTGDLSCANNPATVGPNAGTYSIVPVVSGSGLTNFDITSVNGSYLINKANATINVTGFTGYYDGEPHGATGTATGVLGEDLSAGLNLGATFTNVPGGTAYWTFNGGTNYNNDSGSVAIVINAWTLRGFYQPVDMGGVFNTVKGGSTVPLKFEIFSGSTELTSVSSIKSFSVRQIACSTAAPADEIELVTTGGTSLRYDSIAGQFVQNWQTPRGAGLCYLVVMTAQDGSTIPAYFKTK